MKLSQLFEALSYGELSSLAIGGAGSGVVPEEHWPALITHINTGLTKLYSRFPLVEKELVIQQYASIKVYDLKVDFAVSNTESTEPIKYIIDSVDKPFLEDIIRINVAYGDDGKEVPLNDSGDECSWFTPSYDSVQVPEPVDETTMVLSYRAAHTRLSPDTKDPTSVLVDIPPYLEEALQCYVASRVHSLRSTQEAMSESSLYYSKYNAICKEVEQRNLVLDSRSNTNNKLDDKGYA